MTADTARHVPRQHDKRGNMSVRVWGATKTDLEQTGRKEGFAPSSLLSDVADMLAGYYRHAWCGTCVPVAFGDLSGKPLRDWVIEARVTVSGQKCDAHHPVLVGAGTASQPPSASGEGDEAATREEGAQGRTEPREAVPAQRREVPVLVGAGGAPAAVFTPGLESGPEDCLHPRVRVKGTCPDCHQWVGGKR